MDIRAVVIDRYEYSFALYFLVFCFVVQFFFSFSLRCNSIDLSRTTHSRTEPGRVHRERIARVVQNKREGKPTHGSSNKMKQNIYRSTEKRKQRSMLMEITYAKSQIHEYAQWHQHAAAAAAAVVIVVENQPPVTFSPHLISYSDTTHACQPTNINAIDRKITNHGKNWLLIALFRFYSIAFDFKSCTHERTNSFLIDTLFW